MDEKTAAEVEADKLERLFQLARSRYGGDGSRRIPELGLLALAHDIGVTDDGLRTYLTEYASGMVEAVTSVSDDNRCCPLCDAPHPNRVMEAFATALSHGLLMGLELNRNPKAMEDEDDDE